jgi:hypothetical protein
MEFVCSQDTDILHLVWVSFQFTFNQVMFNLFCCQDIDIHLIWVHLQPGHIFDMLYIDSLHNIHCISIVLSFILYTRYCIRYVSLTFACSQFLYHLCLLIKLFTQFVVTLCICIGSFHYVPLFYTTPYSCRIMIANS